MVFWEINEEIGVEKRDIEILGQLFDIYIEVIGEDELEVYVVVCEVINVGFYELDEI